LDSSARYGHVNGVHALRRVQGTHRWTVTLEDILDADVLLLVGTNITETNPVTGLKVKEAVKKGHATLLTIDSMQPAIGTISNIATLAHQHLCVGPTQLGNAVLGLLKAVIEETLVDATLGQRAPAYLGAITQALQAIPWQELTAATGI